MSSVTEANIDKESTGQDDADDEHADEEQWKFSQSHMIIVYGKMLFS